MRFLNRVLCWLFFHPELRVIHSCSRLAQHVWCPRCDRHFGIHHGVRAFVQWGPELCLCFDPVTEETLRTGEERL
jgi:hypothetical protein